MALEDLKKSLLDMTPEEKLALLRDVRSDRKVSKVAITRKAAVRKTKADKIEKGFKELTPEEQAMLIEMLKGE